MEATSKMPSLETLRLFDSCMTLGRVVHSRYPEYLTADNILSVMDRYCIAEALVHHHDARLVYPREHGNRRLLEAIRGMDRLHPVWVIEPPKRPGQEAAAALVEEMLAAGVRAARLMMKVAPPMLWLWDDLCAVLEDHRVPCFLDFGGTRDQIGTVGDVTTDELNGIRGIALAHPALPLILSNLMGGLGIHYGVVPLIRRMQNIYLDIVGILEFWREVAREVRPERVLFATGAPFIDPGILVSNVQYALDLDDDVKRVICGGNLRRLLGDVR